MANHDNGLRFALLQLTCEYLEIGHPQEEAERLAKRALLRSRSLDVQADKDEEEESLFR